MINIAVKPITGKELIRIDVKINLKVYICSVVKRMIETAGTEVGKVISTISQINHFNVKRIIIDLNHPNL